MSALPGRSRRARAGLALGLAALALAGCEAPPEARYPITEAAAARPAPKLGETARFKRVGEASLASAEALGADRESLAAQAAALRAEASGLAGPVLDPETRARLLAAREDGVAPAPD
ncbi:MAG: hypothetical protein DI556_10050 [Rhodovulum sulfidophilum]|uniref:DUF3035 domain-containing protein n=1 Tax=Rhodovulum sulfidophilum TaxID=35806 RepID=A0A2W5N8M9_RHOSU|nr:MAG: hypothetical protein DI556_10050 [Rhodovulum sulfidophilum]